MSIDDLSCLIYRKMSKSKSFETKFNAVKTDQEKLRKLIETTSNESICAAVIGAAKEDSRLAIWSAVLTTLNNEEKLLEIVKDVRSEF